MLLWPKNSWYFVSDCRQDTIAVAVSPPSSTGLARVAQPVWWITASIKADCRNYCLPFQLFSPLLSLRSPLPRLPCRPAELRLSRCLLLKHFNFVLTLSPSVYSIVTSRLRAVWPESHGSPPGKGMKFFSSPHPSNLLLCPPTLFSVGTKDKAARAWIWPLTPLHVKVKNGLSDYLHSTTWLHGVIRDNFAFALLWILHFLTTSEGDTCFGGGGGFMIYLEQCCLLYYLLICLELGFENFCAKHGEI